MGASYAVTLGDGSSGGYSGVPVRQGRRFKPRSPHMQELINECIRNGTMN